MKRVYLLALVWLMACVCLVVVMGVVGGCSQQESVGKGTAKADRADEVMRRMTKHYSGLSTAVLTVNMTRSMGLDEKSLDKRKFGAYRAYFQSPYVYGSDIEEPRRLSALSKSEADQYGGALVDPAFGYLIIVPQLFQGFQIAETFPQLTYKGQESIEGEATDVILLERDLPGPAGSWVAGVNTLTLWVNERGQLRRFDLALKSTQGKADPGIKDVDYSFRAELTEVDNGPLPSSFLKKVQGDKSLREAMPGKAPTDREVIGRMRKHYAGLQTAILTAETSTSSVVDGKAGKGETLPPYRAYFQSPDLYGSDTEEPRRLSPLSKSQIEELGRALENPPVGRLVIIPELFQDFQIAETFPKVAYKGQESIAGEKADVVVLQRDEGIPSSFGMKGSTVVTLWVNPRGQLARFEVALAATFSKNPNLGKSLYSAYRTNITEIDNGPLPASFVKKAQQTK